jgi:two-component system, sensor histidine kinase and response regulator
MTQEYFTTRTSAMLEKQRSTKFLSETMLFFGIGLATIYWFLDSTIQFLLTGNTDFYRNLIGFDINEVATRMLALCFFMIFGSHAQYTINKRKEVEQALQASEERYRTIIESIEDGYYETDITGSLTFMNEATAKILGHSPDRLLGTNIRQAVGEKHDKRWLETFDKVLQTGESAEILDTAVTIPDRGERFLEASVSLIKNRKDRPTGYRGILRDVTRRKRADALKQEKAAAEAANRSKSEFLANMSHEIRTPLNAIIGLVELLQGTEVNSEQKEDLTVVRSSAYALLALINDILDFSKIEAGRLEIEEIPFSLRDFLGETMKIMATHAHEKNLELAYAVSPDGPDLVIGDPTRLRQVVLNLIGNAIKFTESGEVVLAVAVDQKGESDILYHFTVRDTGIGIAKNMHDLIFNAFNQGDGSTTRRFGGTGLGLAVSSQLVDLMGGRIWVDSEPGQGSEFHFTCRFTLQPELQGIEPDSSIKKISGLPTLIVDDNETSRNILQAMLQNWNLPTRAADSAETAKEILTEHRDIGLIIIDSQMPGTDGLSLARWINENNELDIKIVILATTTYPRQRGRLSEIGTGASLIKPVRPSDLLAAILTALGLKPPEGTQLSPAHDRPPVDQGPPLDILVAEDTPFNQKFISRLLGKWGHRLVIVENGVDTLQALSKEDFDVVLMDVQMPEMDGFEATKALRKAEVGTGMHIPVIAMTAHAMKGDRERCIEAGMDDYLSKPIAADKLGKILRGIGVGKMKKGAGGETMQLRETPFDPAIVLDVFDNDRDFLEESISIFIRDYPPMIDAIRRAMAEKDADGLERAAHALKGMLGNFKADSAARSALALELRGREGQFDGSESEAENLEAEVQSLERHLTEMVKER